MPGAQLHQIRSLDHDLRQRHPAVRPVHTPFLRGLSRARHVHGGVTHHCRPGGGNWDRGAVACVQSGDQPQRRQGRVDALRRAGLRLRRTGAFHRWASCRHCRNDHREGVADDGGHDPGWVHRRARHDGSAAQSCPGPVVGSLAALRGSAIWRHRKRGWHGASARGHGICLGLPRHGRCPTPADLRGIVHRNIVGGLDRRGGRRFARHDRAEPARLPEPPRGAGADQAAKIPSWRACCRDWTA